MAKESPVSIVIALHDGAAFIGQTLQSVLGQTHRAVELIVVNDGSHDDGPAIVRATAPQARLITQANAGVCAARNAGLRLAGGDFVCFLDQDDIWYPDHLETHLRCFAARPDTGVVVSPYRHWYPTGGVYPPPHALRARAPVGALGDVDPDFTGWVYHQFMLDCWALTSATTIRRSVLQVHGGFDESLPFSEDWDLWLRLSREAPFALLNAPPVLYRQHSVQGSRQPRAVDYRTRLLLTNQQLHGLASRDGRALDARVFSSQIARYQLDYGYHQLQHGNVHAARQALWDSWQRQPSRWRAAAYLAASFLSWRPGPACLKQSTRRAAW